MVDIKDTVQRRMAEKKITYKDLYGYFKEEYDMSYDEFTKIVKGEHSNMYHYARLFAILGCTVNFTVTCKDSWIDKIKRKWNTLRSPKGGAEESTF